MLYYNSIGAWDGNFTSIGGRRGAVAPLGHRPLGALPFALPCASVAARELASGDARRFARGVTRRRMAPRCVDHPGDLRQRASAAARQAGPLAERTGAGSLRRIDRRAVHRKRGGRSNADSNRSGVVAGRTRGETATRPSAWTLRIGLSDGARRPDHNLSAARRGVSRRFAWPLYRGRGAGRGCCRAGHGQKRPICASGEQHHPRL
jgi:hypothetical protein